MNMKLSEAIRTGAKLRPASEHGWVDFDEQGKPRSCALVAAVEGVGLISHNGSVWIAGPGATLVPLVEFDPRSGQPNLGSGFTLTLPLEWQRTVGAVLVPPCGCRIYSIPDLTMTLIWHLHDVHRWSREAVAEWIETIENLMEIKPESKAADQDHHHCVSPSVSPQLLDASEDDASPLAAAKTVGQV